MVGKILIALFTSLTISILSSWISIHLVRYKINKRNLVSDTSYKISTSDVLISFIICFVFMLLSVKFEIWRIVFIYIFLIFACIGTIIDNKLRIIPNELILAMFFVGTVFRFVEGGFPSILNSILSSIGILFFLIITFFISKLFIVSLLPGGARGFKAYDGIGICFGLSEIT